ncbi:MAG TPA: AI-2E family transporter [Pseudomonadales bacterium]
MQEITISTRTVLRIVALSLGLIFLSFLLWEMSQVVLVFFAAVLIAILLDGGAGLFERFLHMKHPWSFLLALATIAGLSGLFFYLLGTQINEQFSGLSGRFPQIIDDLGARFGIDDLSSDLLERASALGSGSGVLTRIAGLTSGVMGILSSVALAVVAGIYMGARPDVYAGGLRSLVPKQHVHQADEWMRNSGNALRLWLLGQFVSMLAIGVLTGLGLWALGMPSALALAFLAGVAAFVPIVGPILSAIPALLIAMSEGDGALVQVALLYLGVQQVESYLVTPVVQRKAVDLPPVFTLFAILALGLLFGGLGIILAAPLSVVMLVSIRQLYIREALEKPADIPGRDD